MDKLMRKSIYLKLAKKYIKSPNQTMKICCELEHEMGRNAKTYKEMLGTHFPEVKSFAETDSDYWRMLRTPADESVRCFILLFAAEMCNVKNQS